MTVYLAHAPRISKDGTIPDITGAVAFGSLCPLLQAGEAPGLNPSFCQRRISDRLARFDPNEDHIFWVNGDPLVLMMIAFELLAQGITEFSWLRYSRKLENGERTGESEYIPTKIDLASYQHAIETRLSD